MTSGGSVFNIASVFVILGVMPLFDNLCPSQSTSFMTKKTDFEISRDRFFLSKISNTFVTNSLCSVSLAFDAMGISNKKRILRAFYLFRISIYCDQPVYFFPFLSSRVPA